MPQTRPWERLWRVASGRLTAMVEAMELDLARLANDVSEELAAYVVPPRDAAAVGSPLPDEWFATELAVMRSSLVPPYWTKMRDIDPGSQTLVILDVVVVADDAERSLVAFDPLADGEFVLALRDPDPDGARGVDVVSCHVRGDAVGCFLAR
jgi:hypothetical protein